MLSGGQVIIMWWIPIIDVKLKQNKEGFIVIKGGLYSEYTWSSGIRQKLARIVLVLLSLALVAEGAALAENLKC